MKEICRLCGDDANFFREKPRRYFHCPTCDTIFTCKADLLDTHLEKARYALHTTEIDAGYANYVMPLIEQVRKRYDANAQGLDFGSGQSEIIYKLLKKHHYNIHSYDPFFHNNPQLLRQQYDYITVSEVVEHFYEPAQEFLQLKSMLYPEGTLYIMTQLYDNSIDFDSWHYKNDPTHVVFYTPTTMQWIAKKYNFSSLNIQKRVITFS